MPVLGRFVVVRPLQVVGKVLLGGHVMGIIVGVQVALPVPQRLRSGIVSVTQVLGHRSPTPLSNVREAAVKAGALVRAVGKHMGGGGGGRDDIAQGGGTKPEGIPAALDAIHSEIEAL